MQRKTIRGLAVSLGLALTVLGSVLLLQATRDASQQAQAMDRELTSSAEAAALQLDNHFERAVTADLQLSKQPAFREVYQAPGPMEPKLRNNIDVVQETQEDLATVEGLFPGEVSEACFIDLNTGRELSRIVNGKAAPYQDLSQDESKASFFEPTKQADLGTAYQSVPYVSGDSGLWVVGTATKIAVGNRTPALVHFETSVESLRTSTHLDQAIDADIRVVDANTGAVVMDGSTEQVKGAPLGEPTDATFAQTSFEQSSATTTLDDQRVAYTPLPHQGTLPSINANDWVITASAVAVPVGVMANLTPLMIALFALGLPLLVIGLVDVWRARRQRQQRESQVAEERDLLDARMSDLNDALARAAAGDLDVTCAFDLGDERMTALAHSFDVTLSHLRSLVLQAQDSGARLAHSAAELRASSTQQAATASEQSTAVTETTATVEELAVTAAQIADTASKVAVAARETLGFTEEGLAAVRDSVAAMDRMTDKAESISTSSNLLGEKVNEIGRILAIIDELSEQTNLLALNAAIEAARAGEHGRGFAVVAAEVRKLAERAQESTAQIQALVTEIQAHTNNTVLASTEGAREAAQGVRVAGSAAVALDRIAAMVDSTTTAVAEISVATQQQRSASDQVVVAMGQVSETSMQFAAGSSQVAVSAQTISELATEFDASIAAFGDGYGDEGESAVENIPEESVEIGRD